MNWVEAYREVAFIYHWPPSEIGALTVPELMRWHEAGVDIMERLHGK